MGLRNELDDLLLLQQASQGFADAGQRLRQQAATRKLQQEAPALLASGDIAGITGLLSGVDNGETLRQLLVEKVKAGGKEKKPSLTIEQLQASFPEVPTPRLAAFVGLPSDEQFAGINQIRGLEAEERQGKETERRSRGELQGLRNNVRGATEKDIKALDEERRQLDKVKLSLVKGTTSGDAVAFNFLARALAGEKGPLSNDDINRFVARAFAGDLQKFENFVTGKTTSILTPDQKKAFKELIDVADNNYTSYKAERLGSLYQRAIADNPGLVDENGKLDDSIAERIKQAGLVYDKGEIRAPNVKQATYVGPEADVMKVAATIKDPKTREQALAALKQYEGKVVPDEVVKRIKEAAKVK